MTSFIIIAKNKSKQEEYLKEFYKKHKINAFDVIQIEREENASSIGIEDIKNMQKKIFLKPIKSEAKVVVLESAEILTTEAQNALLKVLEEPPDHTLIILVTKSKEALLPTIISRCKVVELQTENLKLSEKEKEEFETFLEEFPKWGIGERLKKAEGLAKDKQEAIEWIEKLILVLREKMLDSYSSNNNLTMKQPARNATQSVAGGFNNETIKSFQQLYMLLKTSNVNTRFAIENTLLSIIF